MFGARTIYVGLFAAVVLAGTFVPAVVVGREHSVTIDAGKTGEPISKFVYGQFIEHLGRCIYGGIWAEMLEDRKFYYEITGVGTGWEMVVPGRSSYTGGGHPYELLSMLA